MNYYDLSKIYLNTPECHGEIFDTLHHSVQAIPWLKDHRDFVERNDWGLNDRAHHAMWQAIIETMPQSFSALEIGVYRGQTVSLWGLLARHSDRVPFIGGVSPFVGTKDAVNEYPPRNYLADVKTIFDKFRVPWDWFHPIFGYSQSESALDEAERYAPYNVLYIDGSHEYEAVRQDIINYVPLLKRGGILVMDDASCHLNLPPFTSECGYNRCWAGVGTVSDAVRDFLEPRTDFVHCFAVGHNRVFRKV